MFVLICIWRVLFYIILTLTACDCYLCNTKYAII